MIAFTGCAGTIFQLLAVEMIKEWAWKGVYAAIGIAFMVCILPFTLFVMKVTPDHSKGEYAWGHTPESIQVAYAEEVMPQTALTAATICSCAIFGACIGESLVRFPL